MNDRDYPSRPWIGVGVVVFRGDAVLLARRARPPRMGEWSVPGGAQHLGETVTEAARREVLEETGVTIEDEVVVCVEDAITKDADGAVLYHYTLIEVAASWRAGEAVADDDVSEVRWVPLSEVGSLVAHADTRRVIATAARMRGMIERDDDTPTSR